MRKIKIVKVYPLEHSVYGEYETINPVVDQSNWYEVSDEEFEVLYQYTNAVYQSDKYKLLIIEECKQEETLGMISDIVIKAKKLIDERNKKYQEEKIKKENQKLEKKKLSIEEAKRHLEELGFKVEKKEEHK